ASSGVQPQICVLTDSYRTGFLHPSILTSIISSIKPTYILAQPPWQIIPPSVLAHLRRRPALPLFILTTIPPPIFSWPAAECPALTSSSLSSLSAASSSSPCVVPRSASNLENTEKKRVKTRLKKLILKRPPLQALQEKGLIKGVWLPPGDALREREEHRPSLRQTLHGGRGEERYKEKLNLDQSEWEDIHVVTGALKLFFRELPEPLVPYGFFTDIVDTVKMMDHMDKVDRLKCLVLNMPPPNHDTLKFMCLHLRRVLERSDTNRMTTQNIGIVFGPTLMRPERDNGNMAVNMIYQNQAVELILSEFDHIFGTRGLS
ncbi:hypothetical protein XENOCAPTIV_014125, partial [Xenoophorus captivus]